MRIFTEKALKEFAALHPDALLPLQIWADIVENSHWTCYADTDDTPRSDPNSIELELLSKLVADYSDEHYTIGRPSALSIIHEVMTAHHITEPALY